ncbi:unnamed protein product, partial [Fusarium graminearum]
CPSSRRAALINPAPPFTLASDDDRRTTVHSNSLSLIERRDPFTVTPAVVLISDLDCRLPPPPRDPPSFLPRARSRQQILSKWQTNTRSISTL